MRRISWLPVDILQRRVTEGCVGLLDITGDETCFLLCPDDRLKWVWRCLGQRVDSGLTFEHHTGPQQGVMVCSAISFDIRTPLVVIPGTLTALLYVDDILQHVLLLFLSLHPGLPLNKIMATHGTCYYGLSSILPISSVACKVAWSLTHRSYLGRDGKAISIIPEC
ncbi:hypothetical protein LAZ67_5003861 [Cordylochernes scorpioides]|uniref:Reverse transcriptase domain-containing protein n=1 Tax=Cordylochernes scorpioides TaxID=51811 RepID=A0ABY6KHI6_9ARAC|nr:hypothetical protein LAZ67_5003861 [Cordylochernes scorpioides]